MHDAQTARVATVPCPFCDTLNRVDMSRLADRPKCGECGRPLLLDRPIKLTEQNLDRVVSGSTVPVLVDFYADWCAPCKIMAPVLDEVANARTGELLVAKLDTDQNPAASERFGIRGIPTLILFRDGKEAARHTGALPRTQLEAWLAQAGA
jgi:thioredoxin 2